MLLDRDEGGGTVVVVVVIVGGGALWICALCSIGRRAAGNADLSYQYTSPYSYSEVVRTYKYHSLVSPSSYAGAEHISLLFSNPRVTSASTHNYSTPRLKPHSHHRQVCYDIAALAIVLIHYPWSRNPRVTVIAGIKQNFLRRVGEVNMSISSTR